MKGKAIFRLQPCPSSLSSFLYCSKQLYCPCIMLCKNHSTSAFDMGITFCCCCGCGRFCSLKIGAVPSGNLQTIICELCKSVETFNFSLFHQWKITIPLPTRKKRQTFIVNFINWIGPNHPLL